MQNRINISLFLAVGLGGMIGTSLRYIISLFPISPGFPFATLFVNLIGCFLLSFILNGEKCQQTLPPHLMTGLTTGVLGSFTTFSTFAVETIILFTTASFLALIYVLSSVGGGLISCYAGYRLANRKRALK